MYLAADNYGKAVIENRRMKWAGLTNPVLLKEASLNHQNIIAGKINHAVNTFNKAVEEYNFYITSKNKQFNHLSIPDEKLLESLSNARRYIESAENEVRFLNADNIEINCEIMNLQHSAMDLKQNLDKEDAFMKKYVKTLKPFRILLFYK